MEDLKQILELVMPIISPVVLWFLKRATDSIEALNKNVAVIIERLEKHEQEIDRLRDKTEETHNGLIEVKAKYGNKFN